MWVCKPNVYIYTHFHIIFCFFTFFACFVNDNNMFTCVAICWHKWIYICLIAIYNIDIASILQAKKTGRLWILNKSTKPILLYTRTSKDWTHTLTMVSETDRRCHLNRRFSFRLGFFDYVYTNTYAQVGCDSRLICTRSLTGLNSEFSFSKTACFIKGKKPVCPTIYRNLEEEWLDSYLSQGY